MNKLGIRTRVILLALVPSLLIALSLTVIYTHLRVLDLERGLEEQGRALATYLAPASEYGVFSGNLRVLQGLANAAIGDSQVRSVRIENQRNEILTHSGPPPHSHAAFKANPGTRPILLDSQDGRTLFIRTPVLSHELEIVDFALDPEPISSTSSPTIGWVTVELTRSKMLNNKRQIIILSLLIMLLGAGFIIILALRWSRGIVQPISHLTQAVEQLENGQLDTRVSLEGEGELQRLQGSINTMARSLQTAQHDLQEKVDAATRHLRETLRTAESQNIELEAAKEQALAASREKSNFLTHMSHELRTPLNGVLGYCKLLDASPLDPEQRDYAEIIHNSSQNLLRQINELLDLSRIEAGRIDLECTEFHMGECIEDVLDLLAPSAHAKGLELVYFIASDIPHCCQGDPLRIRQVVLNLVANAIKFTTAGSVIVSLTHADEESDTMGIEISVSDTGTGIPEALQQRIFDPYQQTEREHQAEGSGLGLAISAKLAASMDGDIRVESVAGEGSTFIFSLRCCHLPPPVYEQSELEGSRVLLYVPHPFARMSIREQMRNWGIQVREIRTLDASTKGHAHGQNRRAHPDCVILDLSREDDKQQILDRMTLSCPVLILDHRDSALRQHNGEPCAFVRKPVRNAELRLQLQQLTGSVEKSKPEPISRDQNTPQPHSGAHVLLVEDNLVNRKLATTLLENLGIRVSQAGTGQEALEAFFHHRFDLILMDLQLPDRDGLWLTERLHVLESGSRHTPIIALSADAMPETQTQAIAAGMDAFLSKPLDRKTLHQTLARWLPVRASAPGAIPDTPVQNTDQSSLETDLAALLRKDLKPRPSKINAALKAKDWRTLREEVHTIAGGAACCGAMQLKSAASALEQTIVDEEFGSIADDVEQLLREIDEQLEN